MDLRRAHLSWAWIAIALLFVAGCAGNEGEQRGAFISFLQTRVLDKPGVHVPQLSDEDRERFGAYADDYAVITDFNKAMDESVSPKLKDAVRSGSISSVGDVATRLQQLQAAKAGLHAMDSALTENLARADAARAKLDQPADLQPVYDKAYARLVTEPAAAFKSIVPVMDKVLDGAIDLGRYLNEHRASVRISGPFVQTGDPAVQSAINAKLQALQANQQAVQAAQTRMRAVMYGS